MIATVRRTANGSSVLSRLVQRRGVFWLLAPTLGVLLPFFLVPIGYVLFHSVGNGEVRAAFPSASAQIGPTERTGAPGDRFYEALAADFIAAEDAALGEAARRLNYEIVGYRNLILKTARRVRNVRPGSGNWRERLAEIDARWLDPDHVNAFRRATAWLTPYYFLRALDLRQDADGDIGPVAEDIRVFVATLARTFQISGSVTVLCLLLGYPLAGCLLLLPARMAKLLLFCILVPFWTSILVRTSSWMVVLSKEGVINSALMQLGLIGEPLQLVFNRVGLYVTMTHVMLPFMILPIYSVMRSVPRTYLRASLSLGAHPLIGFWKIFVPLTMPGIAAGSLMTFIITIGYYITPTLVGGPQENMITYFIAFYINDTINWGMAAALGTILLGIVMALYFTIGRVVGVHRIVGLRS